MFSYRPVWLVFKVLAFSMVLMTLLNIGIVFVDTLSVYTKLEPLAVVIQNEVSRNNCVPKAITPLFEKQLNAVVEQSSVATKIVSNIKNNVTIENKQYPAIDEEHVKDYGDIQTLAISVTMQPAGISMVEHGGADNNDGSLLFKRNDFEYPLNFIYQVPCLRYLK
ncbi:TPA: hypothetical protein KQG29_001424 [Clostridioides difficile]|nr:hypothetical protein [Clostridioides difficile]